MAFKENMEILREIFPKAWKKVLEIETRLDKGLVKAVASEEGSINLQVNKQFMHDNKNPSREAKKLIQQFQNVKDYSDILFYGIGMGYQINAFREQYPGVPFSIYEPLPEVFYQFLSHADLKLIPNHIIKNIFIETKPEDPHNYCRSYVRSIRSSALVIDLSAYRKLFPDKHKAFFTEFDCQINERRNSLATINAFQKRWTINSIKNFIQVLDSPDILIDKKGYFQNKPAVLVASGPSLEEEINNLKIIKENGMAYIFTVGTAINTLIQHGVYPHAACTYDPTEENQIICKEVLEKGIKSIPLIFGSTVGYETIEKYPGPKMHMLISQDSAAAFYLRTRDKDRVETINDAATIAVITLQLVAQLGFNPIILVGQNLAYLDNKHYAAGSTFHPIEAGDHELNNAVLVKDVYGNKVASSPTFNRMRQQFEIYIGHYKERDVINTTKNGAHIEGARFENLDELIKNELHNRVVDDSWLESEECSYDIEYLIDQSRIMNTAYEEAAQLLVKCKLDLKKINDLKECGDPQIIGQSYDQFNNSMDKLRNNQFVTTFITPMNRLELELLMLAVPTISAETNPIIKAQMMEKEFSSYLYRCEHDIFSISTIFQEMNCSVQCFIQKYKVRKKSARIKMLIIDCDGVLTDGSIYYSASGDELRQFNFKDRIGIIYLRESGIRIVLKNPDDNPALDHLAKKLGIVSIKFGAGDLTHALNTVLGQNKIKSTEIAILMNDLNDWELINHVGLSFAVGNASKAFQNKVDYVLKANGGQGVIMEIVELVTGRK